MSGISQITKALAFEKDIEAIHIVSHGTSGSLKLGFDTLNNQDLSLFSQEIKQWHQALAKNADILLYGCNVAQTPEGKNFVKRLSQLTGANIAASTTPIGNAKLGGDWNLDFIIGKIQAALAFSPEVMRDYSFVLIQLVNEPFTGAIVTGPWIYAQSGPGVVGLTTSGLGTTLPNLSLGDTAPNGALRLTSATTSQSGFVLYNSPISSTSGVNVTFDFFAYGGNGADGLSFFLVDGNANPTQPGGLGAGLGYARTTENGTDIPGLVGGYVGIGFDVYGGFASTLAQTTGIGSGLYPNRVTVRGKESNNYQHIITSASVAGGISAGNVSRNAALRKAQIILTPSNAALPNRLSVAMDLNNNDSFTDPGETIIAPFDITTSNGAVPTTFKFGFASTTGGSTNIHEIRNLIYETLTAPVLADTVVTLNNILEDSGAPSGPVGTLISQLADLTGGGGLNNITDPDTGAVAGVAITAADTNGSWFYTTNGGINWNPLGIVSPINARLLAANANTRIYFQPTANYSGTIPTALTFRAWDQTSGTNGNLANTSNNGGNNPFSTATDTAAITVDDNDIAYAITVDVLSLAEGNTGTQTRTYTITRTGGTTGTSAVNYAITGTATNSTDYNIGGTSGATGVTGTINFAANETSKTITLDVNGDTTIENDETIIVTLSTPTAATGYAATITAPTNATTTIINDDQPSVNFGAATYSTTENTTANTVTIPVTLSAVPLANVTVPIVVNASSSATQGAGADYTLSTTSITFLANTTILTQDIVATINPDDIPENAETVTLDFGTIIGATAGTTTPNTTVTIAANDAISYAIATSATSLTEGNTGNQPVTFTVTRSGGIGVASTVNYALGGTADSSDYNSIGGTSGATATTGTISFAATETSKTITLNVLGDTVAEPDETIIATLSNPNLTAAPESSTITTATATTTIINDDTAGITITPTTPLTTTEAGGTATFTVKLNTQPTADVTLGLTSSNLAEGTVSAPTVTFTSANWDTAQTVTVTGVDDLIADGNQIYQIITAADTTTTDTNYKNLKPADVAVTNTDNDVAGVAGITITPTTGLTTTEAGGTATFDVKLNTQPTANVTLGLTSSNLAEGTVSAPTVTFTSANWDTAQTVTVTGFDDLIADGNQAYQIITAADTTTTDTNYKNLKPADVAVLNIDNETAGITITPTTGLTTTEAGVKPHLQLNSTLNRRPMSPSD